jgi:hypothetical protein
MLKSLIAKIKGKTLTELEKEEGIHTEVVDIPDRYLGSPNNKKFYREGEVDFEKMRKRFDAFARRLGLHP